MGACTHLTSVLSDREHAKSDKFTPHLGICACVYSRYLHWYVQCAWKGGGRKTDFRPELVKLI